MPISSPVLVVLTPRSRPGQAEVGHLDGRAVAEQYVLRLDVAVDDASVVGGGEAREYALDDVECLTRIQPPAGDQEIAQGRAGHVFHRDVMQVAGRALVEDRNDIRAGKAGYRPRLADEPGDEVLIAGQLRMRDLERDGPLQPDVAGVIDRGHAATGNLRLDQVTAVKQLPYRR